MSSSALQCESVRIFKKAVYSFANNPFIFRALIPLGLFLVCFGANAHAAACTAPTGGGVAICSPAAASSDVNPVHYIAAASSPSCAGGISTMSIQPKAGATAYSVGSASLDTFLPQAPGTYTTTIVAKDKCGGTSQKTVSITVRGTAVITYQYNVQRLGANLYETALTPAVVNQTLFGKLFSCPVDSLVYGQPLFMPKLSIGGATHNVVYVATEKNSVYAFDADGKSCTPLWHTVLGTPVPCSANSPATNTQCNLVFQANTIGVTATMFIDPTQGSNGVLYVEDRVAAAGGVKPFTHQLRKLDVVTGKDTSDSPVTINASIAGNACDSVNGVVNFNGAVQHSRPALLYANGEVFIGFGSINDNPNCSNGTPYHGWVLGYNAFNIQQQLHVFNTSANKAGNGTGAGGAGALWGGALAATLSNQIFVATGNGPFNASVNDWNNSYLNLAPSGKTLKAVDYFAPHVLYNSNDVDLCTNTGILVTTSGQFPHELIGGDKSGNLYVVNRDNMGKFNSSTDQNIQTLPRAIGVHVAGAATCGSNDVDCDYSSPVFWNGHIYVSGVNDHVKEFTLSNSLLSNGPVSMSPQTYGYPGATATVSANGTSSAIVWAVEPGKAILHAYDATNLANELYNSSQNPTRDALGSSVKFAPPTVANGKVYIGTKNAIVGYGLLP